MPLGGEMDVKELSIERDTLSVYFDTGQSNC